MRYAAGASASEYTAKRPVAFASSSLHSTTIISRSPLPSPSTSTDSVDTVSAASSMHRLCGESIAYYPGPSLLTVSSCLFTPLHICTL